MTPRTEPASLSLEQKARLLSGQDFWSTRPVADAVPSVVMTDGPHGVRRQLGGFDHIGLNASEPATCFPPAVAVGSSWNADVAAKVGEAIGREARSLGVHVVLGPGVNIKRSPLCGRNFEYYSEDPLLSGVLGAAHVRGQQDQGVGASVKHFAANNQETDRMRVSADVDERTLREIYLPAFERIVTEAAPATVMAAYNKVNGIHACENAWLLTEVLRGEWGFDGAVISDWGGVDDPVASLAAGLDLEMPGPAEQSAQLIINAVRSGQIAETAVDAAVSHILDLADRTVHSRTAGEIDTAGLAIDHVAHHALARQLATECAVLLKNDHEVLPLAPGTRIAVIGELARSPRYQGGGSSHLTPTQLDIPLDALRELAAKFGAEVEFVAGYTLDGTGDAAAMCAAAVEAARTAAVAVVFAGLGEQEESEGFDRTSLDLSAAQVEVVQAVAAAAPRTVVVLSHGGVVSLEGWHDDVDAIVDGFLLGQGGGAAIADLLFGVANPSGRLAETIPARLQDNPSYLNFPGEQGTVRYGEGVMVGYRWYETLATPVRYPFGHGLSYSTFATTDLEVELTGDDTARATVTVTNTGDRAGADVVQVYVATQAGPVRRPVRELRAFTKLHLEPGEASQVTLDLDRRSFAYYDVAIARWVIAAGTYAVQVGTNAHSIVAETTITLPGDAIVTELTLESTLGEWAAHPVVGPTRLADLTADLPKAQGGSLADPELLRLAEGMPMAKVAQVLGGPALAPTLQRLMQRARDTRP